MSEYEPGNFGSQYRMPLGQRVWECLNEPRTREAMILATNLGKPALEGIDAILLERFASDIEELMADRFKQMIGHMTKQVMASAGFVIDQQDVKVSSAIFSRATRYKHRELFVFHAWRGKGRTVVLTATADRQVLPEGSWKYWKAFEAGLPAGVVLEIKDQKAAVTAIGERGYLMHEIPRFLRAAG